MYIMVSQWGNRYTMHASANSRDETDYHSQAFSYEIIIHNTVVLTKMCVKISSMLGEKLTAEQ